MRLLCFQFPWSKVKFYSTSQYQTLWNWNFSCINKMKIAIETDSATLWPSSSLYLAP